MDKKGFKKLPLKQRIAMVVGFYVFLGLLQIPFVAIFVAEPTPSLGIVLTAIITDAVIIFCYIKVSVVHVAPFLKGALTEVAAQAAE